MEQITSLNNQKIKDILKLKQTKYIKQENCVLIEGLNLIKEANKKTIIKSIFITKEKIEKLPNDLKSENYYEISEHIADKISSVKNNQGIFAVVEITNNLIDLDNNILILDDIQDPGNLGTLIRAAAAFKFNTIICSKSSVSFFNEKVIRATQGNLFQTNLVTEDLEKIIKLLKNNEYEIIGSDLHKDFTYINNIEIDKSKKYVLIIGNEGNGISEQVAKYIDINALINIDPLVESLNAATAGSIMMYEIGKNK